MSQFFGRAVPVAGQVALRVSFRLISLWENLTTNGELSSLFGGGAHPRRRERFAVPAEFFFRRRR